MLVAACVGILLAIWFWRSRRKGPERLEAVDLRRLRQISEKHQRDGIHPFLNP